MAWANHMQHTNGQDCSVRLKWQAAPAAALSVFGKFREKLWAYRNQTYTDIKITLQCIWRCMSSTRKTYSSEDILRYQNSSISNFEVHNKEILISISRSNSSGTVNNGLLHHKTRRGCRAGRRYYKKRSLKRHLRVFKEVLHVLFFPIFLMTTGVACWQYPFWTTSFLVCVKIILIK